MKVTNNKIGSPSAAKTDSAKLGKTEGLKKESRAGAMTGSREIKDGSKVDVSERAQMMQKARDIATQPSEVDEARVARLQKMIDEGSYKVDSDKIADKLLDEHMLIPD